MTRAPGHRLFTTGRVTHVPGVWDPASARLAVQAGHGAAMLSGTAVAVTMLGRPDVDFAPATQIADRAAVLSPALAGIPLLADADAGYDRPDDAVWTALAYQRAGVAAVVIRDGADVRPQAEMLAAVTAQAHGIAVIAEARGADLRDTMDRCRSYAAAGVHAVQPVTAEADLDRVHAALPGVPLVLARSEAELSGPRRGDADLAACGVRLVLHPLAAVLAALRAASMAYRAIADAGDADRVDRLPWATVAELLPPPTPRPYRQPAVSSGSAAPPAVPPAPGVLPAPAPAAGALPAATTPRAIGPRLPAPRSFRPAGDHPVPGPMDRIDT